MNELPKNPQLHPEEINSRILAAVNRQRTRIRVLTSLTLLLGILAIAVSILIVVFYPVMYLPKQKQLIRHAETALAQAQTETIQETVRRLDQFMGAEILMTHVISMGTTMIAAAVGLLAFGTLVLVLVVILHRRATLHQISVHLANISNQLADLQRREIKP